MTVTKMNHAMMSFALMGNMLVGPRPYAYKPARPEPQTPKRK